MLSKRFVLSAVPALAIVVGAGVFWARHGQSAPTNQGNHKDDIAQLRPATNLPITPGGPVQQRRRLLPAQGEVEGDARVDLSFPVQDINDLLKSMVLRDLADGHVAAVTYDSHAPIEKTLKSFAINLNGNPPSAQILNQARGEKVEVVAAATTANQPGTLTGTIVGIETADRSPSARTERSTRGAAEPVVRRRAAQRSS